MKITIYYKNNKKVTQELTTNQAELMCAQIETYGYKIKDFYSGINRQLALRDSKEYIRKNLKGLIELGVVLKNSKSHSSKLPFSRQQYDDCIEKIVTGDEAFDEKEIDAWPSLDVPFIGKILHPLPQVLVFDDTVLRLSHANNDKVTGTSSTHFQESTSSQTNSLPLSKKPQPRLSHELMAVLLFCSAHPKHKLAIIEGHEDNKAKTNKAIKQWAAYIKQLAAINIDYCYPYSKELAKEKKLRTQIFNDHEKFEKRPSNEKTTLINSNLAGKTLPLLKLYDEINKDKTASVNLSQITLIDPSRKVCSVLSEAKPLITFEDKKSHKSNLSKSAIDKIQITEQAIKDHQAFNEPGFHAIKPKWAKKGDAIKPIAEQIGLLTYVEMQKKYPKLYNKLSSITKACTAVWQLATLDSKSSLPTNWHKAFVGLNDNEANQILAILVYRDDNNTSLLDKLDDKELEKTPLLNNLKTKGEIKGYTRLWLELKINKKIISGDNDTNACTMICAIIQNAFKNHHWDTSAVKAGSLGTYKTGKKITITNTNQHLKRSFTGPKTAKDILNIIDEAQKQEKKPVKAKQDKTKHSQEKPYRNALGRIQKICVARCNEFSEWQDPSKNEKSKPKTLVETRSLDTNIMNYQLRDFVTTCLNIRKALVPKDNETDDVNDACDHATECSGSF